MSDNNDKKLTLKGADKEEDNNFILKYNFNIFPDIMLFPDENKKFIQTLLPEEFDLKFDGKLASATLAETLEPSKTFLISSDNKIKKSKSEEIKTVNKVQEIKGEKLLPKKKWRWSIK